MNSLPNFNSHGYQVTEQLHHNIQGGRITYKAIEIATNQPVIIKQFSFATKKWDGYKEIEREIQVLQGLNHVGIPKYLAQFDPGDGLCLVQEYINAQPLSKPHSFSPEDIKSIATQLLEILIYLQERIPPIFHRDIKPIFMNRLSEVQLSFAAIELQAKYTGQKLTKTITIENSVKKFNTTLVVRCTAHLTTIEITKIKSRISSPRIPEIN